MDLEVNIMDTQNEFLSLFNELEIYLRIEYNDGRFNESSFMGTVQRIRSRRENALIASKEYFEVLTQAAQIRNIMVHNEDIVVPTEDFMKKFRYIVKMITSPITVDKIMNPIRKATTVSLEKTIEEVIQIMKEKKFSHIPVVEDHKLKGVFTERTLFYYMMMDLGDINLHMTMKDILPSMDLDNDPAEYFAFVARDKDIYEAFALFTTDSKNDKELEILFVTEHGKNHESILGIVTHWDLDQAFLKYES